MSYVVRKGTVRGEGEYLGRFGEWSPKRQDAFRYFQRPEAEAHYQGGRAVKLKPKPTWETLPDEQRTDVVRWLESAVADLYIDCDDDIEHKGFDTYSAAMALVRRLRDEEGAK